MGFMMYFMFDDIDYHPIVNFRKNNAPPCSKCKYFHRNKLYDDVYSAEIQCTCPQAIESYEKEYLRIVDKVDAIKVRGTNNCKFKAVEEPEPTSEKAEER